MARAYLSFAPLFLLLNTILQCLPHSQLPIPPTRCAEHIKKYQVPQNIKHSGTLMLNSLLVSRGSACFCFTLVGGLIDIFIVPQPAGLVFMKYEEIAQKCKCLQ